MRFALLARLRGRLAIVLGLLLIDLVLGSLPDCDLCWMFWTLLLGPLFSTLALIPAVQFVFEWYRGRRLDARLRGWQMVLPLLGVLALPLVGRVASHVRFLAVRPALRSAALAQAEDVRPHLASIEMSSLLLMSWGYLYDDSGEIEKPCGTQSDAWERRADVAFRRYSCSMTVTHLDGPYYRWFDQ